MKQSRQIKQKETDPLATAAVPHRKPTLVDTQLLPQAINAKCLKLKST